MRKLAVVLCVALQLVVLAYMAGNREYIREYGDEIWLPTAPIDPRDPFRGDFVRLQYAINNVPAPADLQGEDMSVKGAVVYAQLEEAARGTFQFVALSTNPPSSGVFLKGRASGQIWRANHLSIEYGIEQFFVQQGRGREIEERRGARNQTQVPMEVLVAVGGDGTGVIKDYRWSDLGGRLEVLRSNRRMPDGAAQDPEMPVSPKLRYTLTNVSDSPVGILESDELCQFVLVDALDPTYAPIPTPQRCGAGTALTIRQLAPGEEASYEVDFALPLWQVRIDDQNGDLGVLVDDWSQRFRLVYSPAENEGAWQGRLPSQAFSVVGQID